LKVLVTGGGGFLGKGIVRELLKRKYVVRSFSRNDYPELVALGAETVKGDLKDLDAVSKAVEGSDAVIHTAAKAGVWGSYQDYYETNVTGTLNVISACKAHGVRKLVYTSSPSVVFDGRDQEGIDESAMIPKSFLAHYPRTKAIAEQEVMAANGPDLATVSLRPHLIWGPNDNHLIPRLIRMAQQKKLRFVGRNDKLVDSVYIDNAVDAHLIALEKLSPESPIAGRVFFITNQEPVPMSFLINGILNAARLPAVTRRIPAPIAYGLGALLESVHTLFSLPGEPRMTRFVARQLSTAHWYDDRAAKTCLGYEPRLTLADGLKLLEISLG
jgi:nucleoside-diphosphate-sugar epimerase